MSLSPSVTVCHRLQRDIQNESRCRHEVHDGLTYMLKSVNFFCATRVGWAVDIANWCMVYGSFAESLNGEDSSLTYAGAYARIPLPT